MSYKFGPEAVLIPHGTKSREGRSPSEGLSGSLRSLQNLAKNLQRMFSLKVGIIGKRILCPVFKIPI
jgi:hypothetical protein